MRKAAEYSQYIGPYFYPRPTSQRRHVLLGGLGKAWVLAPMPSLDLECRRHSPVCGLLPHFQVGVHDTTTWVHHWANFLVEGVALNQLPNRIVLFIMSRSFYSTARL